MAPTVHACRAALLLILMLACGLARAEPNLALSGSAGFGYDSNPANAESGTTVPATGFAGANLAATYTQPLGQRAALLARGSIDGQQYFNDVGLSNAKATLLLRGLYRPGGAFYAPTLAAWGSAAAWQFGGSLRSGAEYRGGAYVSEQLTTAINLRAGGYAAERRATGSTFDLDTQAATLDADWILGARLTAYLGYEFRRGSFAISSPTDPGAAAGARAQETDDAIRRDGQANTVYRLVGHAQIGTLGLNYALTPNLALDAQLQEIHTRADIGDHYIRRLVSVGLLSRF